jgi:hypothetical protein
MAVGEVISAVLPTVASGANVTGIMVTPVTAMAQSRALGMTGGMTDANIAAANTAMGNYFSVMDILHTQPMNPTMASAGVTASQDARNYGMTVAAMSALAQSLAMPASSTLISAMMKDASDGIMDGKNGMAQISTSMGGMNGSSMMTSTTGTTGLAGAMTSFMNSPANTSGLTVADMQALVQKLIGSSGKI